MPNNVRALSLRQPYASLVSLPLKRIETRGWSTSYRGRLLIHAARRWPVESDLGHPSCDALGDLIWWLRDPWTEEAQVAAGLSPDGNLHGFPLPLGAVVASCTLTDVVPMIDVGDHPPGEAVPTEWPFVEIADSYLGLWRPDLGVMVRIDDQRPFGDFSPDRYAWLLDDIKPTTERCPRCWGDRVDPDPSNVGYSPPGAGGAIDPGSLEPCFACQAEGVCDPVPMRGRQGLWRPSW